MQNQFDLIVRTSLYVTQWLVFDGLGIDHLKTRLAMFVEWIKRQLERSLSLEDETFFSFFFYPLILRHLKCQVEDYICRPSKCFFLFLSFSYLYKLYNI